MKILYASDTHVHPAHFSRLLYAAEELQPDAVIVGGDINPAWRGDVAVSIEPHRTWIRERLLPRLQAFRRGNPSVPVLLDLGNDDIAASRSLLEALDGKDLHLLHGRVVRLGPRLAVAGYMVVNPTPFAVKDREKRDCRDRPGLADPGVVALGIVTRSGFAEPVHLDLSAGFMEDDLESLSESMRHLKFEGCRFVFVCHAPPRDTFLDLTGHGNHVGSLAVRRFIERWSADGRLRVSLHGHIHESPWESGRVSDTLGGVPCFNVGQKREGLRALLLDTESPVTSARLVTVAPSGELIVTEEGVCL